MSSHDRWDARQVHTGTAHPVPTDAINTGTVRVRSPLGIKTRSHECAIWSPFFSSVHAARRASLARFNAARNYIPRLYMEGEEEKKIISFRDYCGDGRWWVCVCIDRYGLYASWRAAAGNRMSFPIFVDALLYEGPRYLCMYVCMYVPRSMYTLDEWDRGTYEYYGGTVLRYETLKLRSYTR